jgi:Protein of unknown function (DUF1688)
VTQAAYLRSAAAIRERCRRVYDHPSLPHFTVAAERLPAIADYVAEVTRAAYPDLAIPIHGRFRHFDAAGMERLRAELSRLPPAERARAQVDLVVTSVLLDAGAGAAWGYVDEQGRRWARSEGLAVASLRMFLAGAFSSDPAHPLQADAAGLRALDAAALGRGFQVSDKNPLTGLEGRLALLHGLGAALPRPGALVDRIDGPSIDGAALLGHVLGALGGIWPGRLTLDGLPLGDVWRCEAIGDLVPFHKLSQWLTYSLVEPLAAAGITVTRLDELTGLPEYRNGGLFLDLGAIVPRDPTLATRPLGAGSEPIVEWRALTVILLDELAPLVRARLGRPDLPLANILEGGTWAAGRKIAAERRPGGSPPLSIESDGTVF